jgi:hypothetical protein
LSPEPGAPDRRPGPARVVLVLAGVAALLIGLREFGRSYSRTRWPVTPARIIESQVVETDGGRFHAAIEYEYILAGRVRRGRVPAPPSVRGEADSVAAAYPVGREIAIGFDPGDPEQTVVHPQLQWWPLGLALIGAGLMAAGIRRRKVEP